MSTLGEVELCLNNNNNKSLQSMASGRYRALESWRKLLLAGVDGATDQQLRRDRAGDDRLSPRSYLG